MKKRSIKPQWIPPPTSIERLVWRKYPIFTMTCLSNCYWLANLNKQSHLEVLSRKLSCVKTKASETPSLELRRENIGSAWLSMCWCDHNWREAPSSHPIFAKKKGMVDSTRIWVGSACHWESPGLGFDNQMHLYARRPGVNSSAIAITLFTLWDFVRRLKIKLSLTTLPMKACWYQ